MGATGSKEGEGGPGGDAGGDLGARDAGFITVGTAKSPEQERLESAEEALVRRTRELRVSKPILQWTRKDLEETGLGGRTKCLQESTDAGRVQWTLEAAFSALAKWYARQAKLVTRQQLGLHEEVEEVSYMAKLALSACTKAKTMMAKHVQDAQGLQDLKSEIAALRHTVNETKVTLEKLENALPPD